MAVLILVEYGHLIKIMLLLLFWFDFVYIHGVDDIHKCMDYWEYLFILRYKQMEMFQPNDDSLMDYADIFEFISSSNRCMLQTCTNEFCVRKLSSIMS